MGKLFELPFGLSSPRTVPRRYPPCNFILFCIRLSFNFGFGVLVFFVILCFRCCVVGLHTAAHSGFVEFASILRMAQFLWDLPFFIRPFEKRT